MCVCTFVHLYISLCSLCISVCLYVCISVPLCVYVSVCFYVCKSLCSCVCVCVFVCLFLYISLCQCVCLYVCVFACLYLYIACLCVTYVYASVFLCMCVCGSKLAWGCSYLLGCSPNAHDGHSSQNARGPDWSWRLGMPSVSPLSLARMQYWSHHLLPSRLHNSRKLELGAGPSDLSPGLPIGNEDIPQRVLTAVPNGHPISF